MKYTDKQLAIMSVIAEGNGVNVVGDFVPVDIDQLLERLPYKTSKQSMQFSIRTLIKHGALTKGETDSRRGRKRRVYIATELGKIMAKKKAEAESWTAVADEAVDNLETKSVLEPHFGDLDPQNGVSKPGSEGV